MIIFDADHPDVLSGKYDREGYTPAERRALERKRAAQAACKQHVFNRPPTGICFHCGLRQSELETPMTEETETADTTEEHNEVIEDEGLSPRGVTFDETHEHKDSTIVEAMKTAGQAINEDAAAKAAARQPKRGVATGDLFEGVMVGFILESITHAVEKRKDSEVKVVSLSLRAQPLSADLANKLDSRVRRTLFALNDAQPYNYLSRVNFNIGIGRQNLTIYTTPDTPQPSMLLEGAKITKLYARSDKDMTTGFALCLKATFGPASGKELAQVEAWLSTVRFVEFNTTDDTLSFDDPDEGDDEDDDQADEQPELPIHEFDTDPSGKPVEAVAPAPEPKRDHQVNRKLHSHQSKKAKRGRTEPKKPAGRGKR